MRSCADTAARPTGSLTCSTACTTLDTGAARARRAAGRFAAATRSREAIAVAGESGAESIHVGEDVSAHARRRQRASRRGLRARSGVELRTSTRVRWSPSPAPCCPSGRRPLPRLHPLLPGLERAAAAPGARGAAQARAAAGARRPAGYPSLDSLTGGGGPSPEPDRGRRGAPPATGSSAGSAAGLGGYEERPRRPRRRPHLAAQRRPPLRRPLAERRPRARRGTSRRRRLRPPALLARLPPPGAGRLPGPAARRLPQARANAGADDEEDAEAWREGRTGDADRRRRDAAARARRASCTTGRG